MAFWLWCSVAVVTYLPPRLPINRGASFIGVPFHSGLTAETAPTVGWGLCFDAKGRLIY